MTIRNIVKIDEEKCNGCGQCVTACAEGAIKLINGKAKLVSEIYCDGLGACLGHCPMDAITVEKRDCADFNEEAVKKHLENEIKPQAAPHAHGFVCPGTMAKQFAKTDATQGDTTSQLTHWPVQLSLISPNAPFLKDADLLLTADCVPFAMGDFHSKLLKDHKVIIACPKLDDVEPYIEKMTEIIRNGNIKSLTVVHMEVPCCFGLMRVVQQAIANSGKEFNFKEITIGLDGQVK
ncbi:MAG: 4Fe-4S ferredoxin [Planctomycetes bacterium GWF2_42_9]|nr:MAG: 4Fe-4S ferredoxin [Planctomycetes bacterium GWF2_42_9]